IHAGSSSITTRTFSPTAAGKTSGRGSIQVRRQGRRSRMRATSLPTWPAPKRTISRSLCVSSISSFLLKTSVTLPPQHWPSESPSAKRRSRRASPESSISRAILSALYSRLPPPIVPRVSCAETHIRVPASLGAEPSVLATRISITKLMEGPQFLLRIRRGFHRNWIRRIARRAYRVVDRVEHREREHERRLADRLGAVGDVAHVAAALPERDVEHRRAVARHGNLVGRGRMRLQLALRVPDELLARQPAHALDEAALDLAAVDGRVERAPDVVQQVGAQQARLPGQRVDDHFGAGRAVGEVVVRLAPPALAVEMQSRRAPVAGGGERDAREERIARELREAEALRAADQHLVVGEHD